MSVVAMSLRITSASTASLPLTQRCAYWESYSSDRLVDLKCTPYDPRGLMAEQDNIWSHHLGLSIIRGNSHIIERTPLHIQRTPKDSIFISFDFISAAFFYQGNQCLAVQPHDMVIYRTDNPYLFGFKSNMRQIIIDLPAETMQHIHQIALDQPVLLRATTAPQRLLQRTLAQCCRHFMAQPCSERLVVLQEQIIGLMTALLCADRPSMGQSGLSLVYVLAAQQFIAEHLDEPTLSNARIAAAVGVSERHLQRIFRQCTESSLQNYVINQRLQRAYWRLMQAKGAVTSIERLGAEVGFISTAHFSRRFKQRYGFSPSQLNTQP